MKEDMIMKITQATDYAARALIHLARLPGGTMVEAGEIAECQSIPESFLLKIFRSLAAAGIVGSQRGPGGGFFLRRDPSAVSILDILEAVEGRTGINHCLVDADRCGRHAAGYCSLRRTLASVQNVLTTELARYTVGDLASREPEPGDA
ncbi:MAG: Rrf2 family transcriptional regulator [Peptococcaceae bacterium]|nr:Rrf2 family transcriptional regulator [Peptococcaceae bacterium]